MSFEKGATIFVIIYSIGAWLTYGHILNQFRAECPKDCYGIRVDAGVATMFWPYHWSEVAWKK